MLLQESRTFRIYPEYIPEHPERDVVDLINRNLRKKASALLWDSGLLGRDVDVMKNQDSNIFSLRGDAALLQQVQEFLIHPAMQNELREYLAMLLLEHEHKLKKDDITRFLELPLLAELVKEY